MDIHKAEIFGKEYVIEELIYNLTEKIKERNNSRRVTSYICKSLQLIPQGKYLSEDIFSMFDDKPKKERTAKEIVEEVVEKAGLVRLRSGKESILFVR